MSIGVGDDGVSNASGGRGGMHVGDPNYVTDFSIFSR